MRGLAPHYLSSKFKWREIVEKLRDSENILDVPLPRSDYYKIASAVVAPFSGTVFTVVFNYTT